MTSTDTQNEASKPSEKKRKFGETGKKRKKAKRTGAHLMDVVIDAYIRDLSLDLYHALEDMTGPQEQPLPEALALMGTFTGLGAYAPIWRENWAPLLANSPQTLEPQVFVLIERAVGASIHTERSLRQERGDVLLEDTPRYKEFVGRVMGRLLIEASGENEEMV